MISSEAMIGLPEYQVTEVEEQQGGVRLRVRYEGEVACPHCQGKDLRIKDRRLRRLRHESWGTRRSVMELETRKWLCRSCRRSFWQRFPGIQPRRRATEPFRRFIFQRHWDGVSRSRLSEREQVGSATVERWFQDFLRLKEAERRSEPCPQILGIDEHFFTRRQGYATTFCDLKHHKIYDVVLGRSQLSLQDYMAQLQGKSRVRLVCMDLAVGYRSLVKQHFPNARIVADRFHVIRLINHHFLACWRQLDASGSKNRGLLSLMRRHRHKLSPEQLKRLMDYLAQHPALDLIYRFKQKLCYLLMKKHRTRKQCQPLATRFLKAVHQLRQAGLPQLMQLGETLYDWRNEIALMWRFTRNNGITEGFHTKMEVLQRQAYGFRNFASYRLRVKIMCRE